MRKARTARNPRKATPTDVRIGRLIRAQRRVKGLTLIELADAVGVAHQQLQKYETGLNRVPGTRLVQIAKLLDMPISDFFEGIADRKDEMENLALIRSAPALRLLRAFNALKSRSARYRVLEMVEKMARK
jgi:transcriptional regulator with XRE-family HTH domain